MKIKLNKSQWEQIGENTGWITKKIILAQANKQNVQNTRSQVKTCTRCIGGYRITEGGGYPVYETDSSNLLDSNTDVFEFCPMCGKKLSKPTPVSEEL